MYIFCELWSGVVINLMFWQFANHIFDTKHAKRFYPTLAMVGNLGLIFAGNILIFFAGVKSPSNTIVEDAIVLNDINQYIQCQNMLQPIISITVCFGIISLLLFNIMHRYILKSDNTKTTGVHLLEDTKTKLSLKDSFKLIAQSKYIGHIVLLLICYGLVINILEGPWKAKIRQIYPDTINYIAFMGHFNILMGISSVIFTIIGSNILRRSSWLFSATLTPAMLLCSGMIFFIFVLCSANHTIVQEIQKFIPEFNPLYAAVIVGAMQNILSKSTKYSLFDSTKEMAYIPLSMELRTKGKAAVEVIGSKFGKSLGAFIQSMIFIIIPSATFDSIIWQLLVVFVIVVVIWIKNTISLNHEYLKLVSEK
jgi:ATP/ADP translocase